MAESKLPPTLATLGLLANREAGQALVQVQGPLAGQEAGQALVQAQGPLSALVPRTRGIARIPAPGSTRGTPGATKKGGRLHPMSGIIWIGQRGTRQPFQATRARPRRRTLRRRTHVRCGRTLAETPRVAVGPYWTSEMATMRVTRNGSRSHRTPTR